MGYRCKNCGYSFREGDGDICPECLTPMEQSADCSQYHSHDAFEDKGFSNPAYGNPTYSQRNYQQSTFSTNSVQKPKKKNGFLRAFITIIVLVVIGNVVLPLITRLFSSNAFDDIVDSVVSEVVTSAADENLPEVSTAVPQDNTLAVGESLDINAEIIDNDIKYTYLKLTNLGQTPDDIDFGENHQIYALDIEIYAPSKEYSSSDITHIYFSPKIVANYVDYEGNVKNDVYTLHSMPNTTGMLPNQLDNSIIVKNDTTVTGTMYFDIDINNYTNKVLMVEFDYRDDAGKLRNGKVTLAQIDKETKK